MPAELRRSRRISPELRARLQEAERIRLESYRRTLALREARIQEQKRIAEEREQARQELSEARQKARAEARRLRRIEQVLDGTATDLDPFTPWTEDKGCRYIVACHPDGLTLDQVGQLFGVTGERIRQIEEKALRKLRGEAKRLDLDLRDFFHPETKEAI